MVCQGLVATLPTMLPWSLGGWGAVAASGRGRPSTDDCTGASGCGAHAPNARAAAATRSGRVFMVRDLSAGGLLPIGRPLQLPFALSIVRVEPTEDRCRVTAR